MMNGFNHLYYILSISNFRGKPLKRFNKSFFIPKPRVETLGYEFAIASFIVAIAGYVPTIASFIVATASFILAISSFILAITSYILAIASFIPATASYIPAIRSIGWKGAFLKRGKS